MGGAERVTLNLIDSLDRTKVILSIYLFRKEGVLLEEVPEDVTLFGTKSVKTKIAFWTLAKFLKKNQFDLIYSVTDGANIASLLALMLISKRIKIVCSSHSTFSKIGFKSRLQKKMTYFLIDSLYKYADKLIVISNDSLRSYQKSFPSLKGKFRCIYNAAFTNKLFTKQLEELEEGSFRKDSINLFSCGRLVKPKGFPYLIKAVKLLSLKYKINLLIAGEGPDRNKLEELVEVLELKNSILLIGNQNNPYKFMSKCDIYVHSSLWDGLPTTLIEAMACGAPVVSTDCDSGPREIISHGIDGLLVRPPGNAKVLADGIEKLILNERLRLKFKISAKEKALSFSSENIVKQYEQLFLNLLAE